MPSSPSENHVDGNPTQIQSSHLETAVRLETGIQALKELRADLMLWLAKSGGENQPRLGDFLNQAGARPEPVYESLEHLLLKVLSRPGGEAQLLATLDKLPLPAAISLLQAGIEAAQGKPSAVLDSGASPTAAKESTFPALAAIQGQAGDTPHPATPLMRLLLRTLTAESTDSRFTGPEEGLRTGAGLARVLARENAGDIQARSNALPGLAPEPGTPLLRVQLWDGQKPLTLLTADAPVPGTLVRYVYADAGGATFPNGLMSPVGPKDGLMQASGAPQNLSGPVLASTYAEATPAARLALAMAEDMLAEIRTSPIYAEAVRDWAGVLVQSGWFGESAASPGMASPEVTPPTRPEAAALLRLWLDYPMPAEQEPLAIRNWAQLLREPQAALPYLNGFRPAPFLNRAELPASPPLLAPDTRLVPLQNPDWAPLAPTLSPAGQALFAKIKDGLTPGEWVGLLQETAVLKHTESKDLGLGPFLHHAANQAKPEGPAASPDMPMTVYWFQGSQWQSMRLQGDGGRERDNSGNPEGRGGKWTATVGWQGEALGQAEAKVFWSQDAMEIEVSNEGVFAQDAMAAQIPRLEVALAHQGLTLKGWRYFHQPPAAAPETRQETAKLRLPAGGSSLDLLS